MKSRHRNTGVETRVPFVGSSIWGFGGFSAILAGLPYLQRICSRPSSPTIPRPLHHYFQQLVIAIQILLVLSLLFSPAVPAKSRHSISDIETRQKKTQCYADIERNIH